MMLVVDEVVAGAARASPPAWGTYAGQNARRASDAVRGASTAQLNEGCGRAKAGLRHLGSRVARSIYSLAFPTSITRRGWSECERGFMIWPKRLSVPYDAIIDQGNDSAPYNQDIDRTGASKSLDTILCIHDTQLLGPFAKCSNPSRVLRRSGAKAGPRGLVAKPILAHRRQGSLARVACFQREISRGCPSLPRSDASLLFLSSSFTRSRLRSRNRPSL